MIRPRILLLAAALLASPGLTGAAAIPDASPRTDALMLAQAGDVGAGAAAAAAQRATGGTVLGVQASRSGGRVIYRVKVLLPGGRVRTVTVDGASGQVLG